MGVASLHRRRYKDMRPLRPLVVASFVLALAAPAPASAEDSLVYTLLRPSAIRSYADIQVLNNHFVAYHLAIRREGVVENLPVEPSREPFDADIGPDANGRPHLVYSRCDPGCDLFSLSLSGRGTEQPVPGANTSANEFAPTLWRGRIAFARARQGRAGPVVYTRELTAPRSRRSERLPAVPRRARGERPAGGRVTELELSGNRLAQIVSFRAQGQLSEVRLVDVSDGSTRRLARVGVGEGGQYFAGIGFAHGYLGWAFDRGIGGGSNISPGIYRYRISTGELSVAAKPRVVDFQVFGMALFAADGAYIVDAQLDTDDGCGGDPEAPVPVIRPCQVIRSTAMSFRPITR